MVAVIDIHAHVISDNLRRYPLSPVAGKVSEWALSRAVTRDRYVQLMDEVGIGQAALVQASTANGFDNSYTADSVAANPDRFAGVCCIDVRAADAADQLSYWITERGMGGLRLFTTGSTMTEQADWLNDPKTFPTWERAGELGIALCVQMQTSAIPRLVDMLERFSHVRVILDHLSYVPVSDGPPFSAAESFFALARYRNVYLKLTVRNFTALAKVLGAAKPFLQRLVDTFGADHIAWGSNYPAADVTLQELLHVALEGLAFLPEADRSTILAGTARTLYPGLVTRRNEREGGPAG
jgi:predicted TIM-barrel fold metal-dependent hydrolase